MKKIKYIILLIIILLSLISSAILSFVPAEQACVGIQTSCYAIQNSGYEQTLGINNSYFGLIAFSLLSILIFLHIKKPSKHRKKLIILGIIFGSLFAIYFLYLQFFVIQSLCKYCMVIDIGMLLSLGIITFWKEKK